MNKEVTKPSENQAIDSFINSNQPINDIDKLILTSAGDNHPVNKLNKIDIGDYTIDPASTILLDYQLKDDGSATGIVGFEGPDGQRLVTSVEFPSEILESDPKISQKIVKSLKATGAVALTTVFLLTGAGCTAQEQHNPTASVSPTTIESPAPSETSLNSPLPSGVEISPEPSSTPIETPTPTIDQEAQAEAKLNQQIQDFLNKEGDFSVEKMTSMMILTNSSLDADKVGLGVADLQPRLEGYFFDYVEKDGVLLMIMGFDGENGQRVVTPVEVPVYFFKAIPQSVFEINELQRNYISSDKTDYIDYSDNQDELLKKLDSLKGKVLALNINYQKFPLDSSVEDYGSVAVKYVTELNSKVDLAIKLFQSVASNGLDFPNSKKTGLDSISILSLENVTDIKNIDPSKAPIVNLASYDKNK